MVESHILPITKGKNYKLEVTAGQIGGKFGGKKVGIGTGYKNFIIGRIILGKKVDRFLPVFYFLYLIQENIDFSPGFHDMPEFINHAGQLGAVVDEIKLCHIFVYIENIIAGYVQVFNEMFDHHSQEVTFADPALPQDDFYQLIVQIPGDVIQVVRPGIAALNFFIGPVVIFFQYFDQWYSP
jgi:hypothetical protein